MTTLDDLMMALGLLFVSGLLLGGALAWLGRGWLMRREYRRAMQTREPWHTITVDRR